MARSNKSTHRSNGGNNGADGGANGGADGGANGGRTGRTGKRHGSTAAVTTPARRCHSRQYNRKPLGDPPAQAARTTRQHVRWAFH